MTTPATTVSPDHPRDEADEYTVRPFASDDESAVLGLGGGERSAAEREEWFDWHCRENPFLDHVPIAVVERGGEIVGSLPFLAVRVRAGDERAIAFAPGEAITALGEDEQELAARALEGAIDYYAAAALAGRPPTDVDVVTGTGRDPPAIPAGDVPAFFFTFGPPGDADGDWSVATDEGYGWQRGVERVSRHRIQRSGAFVAARVPSVFGRALGAPFSAVGGRVRRWRDGRADFDTDPYVAMHHEGVPAATLAACYEAAVPTGSHVVHDAPFFRWWYARPTVTAVQTYVAYRGSDVAAALVAYREARNGPEDDIDAVTIGHVLPLTGDPDRPDAVAAAMERLLAEHADADVVRTRTPLLPEAVRDAYGFRRGDAFPTSLWVGDTPRTVVTRPTITGERTLGDRPIGEVEPFLWQISE